MSDDSPATDDDSSQMPGDVGGSSTDDSAAGDEAAPGDSPADGDDSSSADDSSD